MSNYIVPENIEKTGFVTAAFSLRDPREKLYFRAGEIYEEIVENNRRFLEQLDLSVDRLVTANQKHTNNVHVVTADDVGCSLKRDRITDTDGMVTDIPGAVLVIDVADCAAIYLADSVTKSIGLCHAGRKGALSKIAAETVRKMSENFGADPANIVAWISPCICRKCYEVGPEVEEETWELWGEDAKDILWENIHTGRVHFDLKLANELVLREAGIRDENLVVSRECTCCDTDRFYSFRGDGKIVNEMGAYFAIKAE
ncbi:MAG: peptidoglycan editing factor PgeF [Clostridia bacterium]|nr:peptidoglycan editing factor PgeF [Clostridia bacterium]